YENHALRIGRPCELGDSTAQLAHALRLTAAPIEQPDLRSFSFLASGQKCQVTTVRAPTRRALAFRTRRHADRRGAVPARHPDIVVRLVLRRIDRRDGIRDPSAVGRDLGITNVFEVVEVAAPYGTFRLSVGW